MCGGKIERGVTAQQAAAGSSPEKNTRDPISAQRRATPVFPAPDPPPAAKQPSTKQRCHSETTVTNGYRTNPLAQTHPINLTHPGSHLACFPRGCRKRTAPGSSGCPACATSFCAWEPAPWRIRRRGSFARAAHRCGRGAGIFPIVIVRVPMATPVSSVSSRADGAS
jgi:hypothetical protein